MKKETQLLSHLHLHHNLKKNMPIPDLIKKTVELKEGILSSEGAVFVNTGKYTGRSPKDKFIVFDEISEKNVDWREDNQAISEMLFDKLYEKVIEYLSNKKELFHFSGFAGADKEYQLPIEVFNEFAWHNLFAQQLFIKPTKSEFHEHKPKFTIVSAPTYKANPNIDGTNSEAFILISFKKRIILIGGTEYAGEMKKSIFSVMNYLLPKKNVLPMHCSAIVDDNSHVALFFGLSGTGKTTLSSDLNYKIIGDDEHGWSPTGVFNIEGGCYAKCANLSNEQEPQIYNSIQYGSVLENVKFNHNTLEPNYNDTSVTENTRATYSIDNIENSIIPSIADHPKTIFFLTADASGTLPPISKLNKEQVKYYFLSGYTSKLSGTERGIKEPQSTFSTCFASPFIPLKPSSYADMLIEKIETHNTDVFLINTGWTGGSYGIGERMPLAHTRTIIRAAVRGELNSAGTFYDEIFGLEIPKYVPGIPSEVLYPKNAWDDQEQYNLKAKELRNNFHENIKKFL